MSNLMANYINIIIILLTIILIKLTKATIMANGNGNDNNSDELYGNFTTIEFLKDFIYFEKTYDNVLIMHNQNTTIAAVFYRNNISELEDNSANKEIIKATSGFDILGENLTTESSAPIATATSASSSLPSTFVAHLMYRLQVSVLQLNELKSFYLKRHLGEHLLSIVYIDINIEGTGRTLNDHKGLLQQLSMNLLHMTTTKVLFLINFPLALNAVGDDGIVKGVILQIFQYCWQQKIINVIALLADYQTTKIFYSYTHFPEFQVETKTITYNRKEQKEIYPYRLGNLLGYNLPIAIGGSDPRIIPIKTSSGTLVIAGFVGHFLEAFAKKYNCKLIQPLPFKPESPIPAQDLIKAVRNGTVEISAGLTFPEIPFKGYTYAYEQLNWCIMIPVEANVPDYKFFTLVFKGETYVLVIGILVVISMLLSAALYLHGYSPDILDIICHDDCLRGILGQSFSEIVNPPKIVRFIYLQICILGILLTTTYNSYYSTYVTSAPKEATLNTFDDILRSGLKVVAWEPEYMELLGRVQDFKKYTPLFLLEKDYQKYLKMRDSFNTQYGYVVPTTKWTIVQEQQKIFTAPLFRQTPNFCFFNGIPMCFPVHENSIFNSLLYQLILETSHSGLMNYWSEYGFYELIKANKLQLEDLSTKQEFQAMKVDDLQYIFIFLGGMLVFVILVFIGELLVFYRKVIWARIKNCCCRFKRQERGINGIQNIQRIRTHNNNYMQFNQFD